MLVLVATATTTPLVALRTEIEFAAQDPTLPVDERAHKLRLLREELVLTLGALDTYIAGAERFIEAQTRVTAEEVERFRESPKIREVLLREGWTPEQLDEAGILSAEEIERLEEEGLLEATVGSFVHRFDKNLHPRDRRGRFRDTPDRLVNRQTRSDMEWARDHAREVRVRKTDGTEIVGGVRSATANGLTVEDRDGNGHRVRWEQIESAAVDTGAAALSPGVARMRAKATEAQASGRQVTVTLKPNFEKVDGSVVAVTDQAVTVHQDNGIDNEVHWDVIDHLAFRRGRHAKVEAPPTGDPLHDGNAAITDPQGRVSAGEFLLTDGDTALAVAILGAGYMTDRVVGFNYRMPDGRVVAFRDVRVTDIGDRLAQVRLPGDYLSSPFAFDQMTAVSTGSPLQDRSIANAIRRTPRDAPSVAQREQEYVREWYGDDDPHLWRKYDSDPAKWEPPPKVTYAPAVQAINTPEDAERYLQDRGIRASLKPPPTEHGENLRKDADFFRQIAQAVTDAQDGFPVLRNGPFPLREVKLWSNLKHRPPHDMMTPEARTGIWAVTAVDIDDGKNREMTSAIDGTPEYVGIAINDHNVYGLQDRHEEAAGSGLTANADLTPYGRMLHELGHAVYAAAGYDQDDMHGIRAMTDEQEADPHFWPTLNGRVFEEANLDPFTMQEALGDYAASSIPEAWAELFATLHVPGALGQLPPEIQEKFRRAQEIANRSGVRVL